MAPMRLTSLIATAALALGLAAPALAQDRTVSIANNTGFEIIALYGTAAGAAPSEDNIFAGQVLPSGGSLTVDFSNAEGACVFDLRAVFDDGDEAVQSGVDVCTVGSVTYN
jgi:hypothetical protein